MVGRYTNHQPEKMFIQIMAIVAVPSAPKIWPRWLDRRSVAKGGLHRPRWRFGLQRGGLQRAMAVFNVEERNPASIVGYYNGIPFGYLT